MCVRLADQVGRVARDADHLKTRLLKDADDALAHQRLVLADHDSDRHAGNATAWGYPNGHGAREPGSCPYGPVDHPETELERTMLDDPRLRAGLAWALPGFGHPEGLVGEHVATMLAAIPATVRCAATCGSWRLCTTRSRPRSARVSAGPDNDHAAFARRFAQRFASDQRLLCTLELHDEPYWISRTAEAPEQALRRLLDRLPDSELFTRAVELDAATEGKDLTFLWWLRRELATDRLPSIPSPSPTSTASASFTSKRSPPHRF
jgi:hypothetical protein